MFDCVGDPFLMGMKTLGYLLGSGNLSRPPFRPCPIDLTYGKDRRRTEVGVLGVIRNICQSGLQRFHLGPTNPRSPVFQRGNDSRTQFVSPFRIDLP